MFTNAENKVYIFDLYNGFKETYTVEDSDGGDAFVAPRGTVGVGTDHTVGANCCHRWALD